MEGAWAVVLFVGVLVIGILAVVWASLKIATAVFRRRGGRRVAEQLEGREIVCQSQANSFGAQSAGRGQARGTGTLVLTRDELRFVGWGGARDLVIPLAAITAVDSARSHLGKTVLRDLLRVTWQAATGEEDVVALWVADLDGWTGALQAAPA